jgi:hypothetical protein
MLECGSSGREETCHHLATLLEAASTHVGNGTKALWGA